MINGKKIVALLPLKAHSERIAGKNFKVFAGKPLFKWILDTLLAIKEIDKVVINTDARSMLHQNGLLESDRVFIRDREPVLQGDHVSMNKILADDVNAISSDIYLMTHTTNPLLSGKSILDALATYLSYDDRDSLFTVNRIQTRFYREDLSPVNHDPDNLVRTQDLEPWFEENSCLYIFTQKSFIAANARIGLCPVMYEIPKLESVDIDNPEDWLIAEALAKHLY